jgi:hypothetical protein
MAHMTDSPYPSRPHRPNFTDIRTMQIFDPIAMDGNAGISTHWGSLTNGSAVSGGTLENGVRIKNTHAHLLIAVATTSTGTACSGFTLGQDEELFLEVRQLGEVWVQSNDGTTGSVSYIAS